MRLINFGAGEITDRLTILALKLHHADASGKALDHFRHEQVALLAKLKAGNGLASFLDELLELATVNALLWQAEDQIRAYRNGPAFIGMRPVSEGAETVAEIAFRIQELNDRRAVLIEAINQKTGEHRGQEKLS
jgi:hypothetical protein